MNRTSIVYRGIARDVAERALRELGGAIHAIVLYGSVGRGAATRESDIDLLVLTENKEQIKPRMVEIELEVAARHHYQAFATSVYLSPEEMHFLGTSGSPFVRSVVEEGVILYDDGSFARVRDQILARGRRNAG